jgi:hypothetical protein
VDPAERETHRRSGAIHGTALDCTSRFALPRSVDPALERRSGTTDKKRAGPADARLDARLLDLRVRE